MMRLSGSQVETELLQAREAYNRGDVEKSSRILAAVLRSNPDHAGAHFGRGMILVAEGDQPGALACFVDALRCDPLNIESLAWATLTSLNLQDGEQAERFARRLVKLQPGNDRAHFLLSNSLSLQWRLLDSLEFLERALALQPIEPDYVTAKAQLLKALHWSSQSIDWFRKAIKLRPTSELHVELAEVLIHEGQIDEAITILEQIAHRLPEDKRPHALMAQAYTEAQRFEPAATHWALAKKLAVDPTPLVFTQAQSEIYAGRLDLAEAMLRDALDRDPNASQYYQLLTTIRKMSAADGRLIENMERLFAGRALLPAQERDLRYALAKAYNDLGDYAKAMFSYNEANRLAYELSPICKTFDREAWREYTDLHIKFFTKDRIDTLSREGLQTDFPLFVLGMIRSGTTLTEQILSRHSKIEAGGEKTFWADSRSAILDERSRFFDTGKGRRLGETFLRTLRKHGPEARYVTEKNPANISLAALIHCIYPRAKLLHIKRRPVDNLLSIWMTPIETGLPFVYNKQNLVFAYCEYLRLEKHLSEILPVNRFRTFEYEQLTSNPSGTIDAMLEFLELESEPACLHPEANTRTVRTPSLYQARQPINTDSQEKWRKYEPWLGEFAELIKWNA